MVSSRSGACVRVGVIRGAEARCSGTASVVPRRGAAYADLWTFAPALSWAPALIPRGVTPRGAACTGGASTARCTTASRAELCEMPASPARPVVGGCCTAPTRRTLGRSARTGSGHRSVGEAARITTGLVGDGVRRGSGHSGDRCRRIAGRVATGRVSGRSDLDQSCWVGAPGPSATRLDDSSGAPPPAVDHSSRASAGGVVRGGVDVRGSRGGAASGATGPTDQRWTARPSGWVVDPVPPTVTGVCPPSEADTRPPVVVRTGPSSYGPVTVRCSVGSGAGWGPRVDGSAIGASATTCTGRTIGSGMRPTGRVPAVARGACRTAAPSAGERWAEGAGATGATGRRTSDACSRVTARSTTPVGTGRAGDGAAPVRGASAAPSSVDR